MSGARRTANDVLENEIDGIDDYRVVVRPRNSVPRSPVLSSTSRLRPNPGHTKDVFGICGVDANNTVSVSTIDPLVFFA